MYGGLGGAVRTLRSALSKYLPCHPNRENQSIEEQLRQDILCSNLAILFNFMNIALNTDVYRCALAP